MEVEIKSPQTIQTEEPKTSPDMRSPAFPTPAHTLPNRIPKWIAITILLIIGIIFTISFLGN